MKFIKKVDLYVFVFSPSCSNCVNKPEKIDLRLENPNCDEINWYVEGDSKSKKKVSTVFQMYVMVLFLILLYQLNQIAF